MFIISVKDMHATPKMKTDGDLWRLMDSHVGRKMLYFSPKMMEEDLLQTKPPNITSARFLRLSRKSVNCVFLFYIPSVSS